MDAYVEIIREDGTLERVRIEGEQATVGRSPAAGIPIPDARDLDPEHLLIAPRGDGCWVAIAKGASPVYVHGEEFRHGIVAWGTEIVLGRIKLRVTDALPKEKSERKVGNPVLIAFFVIVPLAGWMLLSEPETELDTSTDHPPPSLFEDQIDCPVQGTAAQHRADQDAEAAIAKSERYPFSAQDGVQSVRLYRRAHACYASLGQSADAQRMEREAGLMRRRIEEDYRTHRLRLERSLEHSRMSDALLEARALIELLRHREGDPYLSWLILLSRQLQLRIDQSTT